MIGNTLVAKGPPVCGGGQQVRDWLYVRHRCSAIRAVLAGGRAGEVYNRGGWNQKPDLKILSTVCALLDELALTAARKVVSAATVQRYSELITYSKSRPGYDRRYAIDARKIESELGWRPAATFDTGICKTVQWYLAHCEWVVHVQSGAQRGWVDKHNPAGATYRLEPPVPKINRFLGLLIHLSWVDHVRPHSDAQYGPYEILV